MGYKAPIVLKGFDAPLNFLKDPKVGPKMKQQKKKKIKVRSLVCDTYKVQGHVEAPKWD
jgi:hypothetical protein